MLRPATQSRPGLPDQWKTALIGTLLAGVTLLAYVPALRGGFIWDDDAYVTGNPLLTAPDGLWRIWFSRDSPSQYFPLTYTTFYLERWLWGLNPLGYHLVNVLLHVVNVLLAWRLLARLRVPGAWLAAALFALHPVQVETVAWITERKNVLMGLFFLLTLHEWVGFTDEQSGLRWRHYVLALVFYALALAAKTTACTMPAALLLILWLRKTPINGWRLAQVVPFAVMGLGLGLVTMWWERHLSGTVGRLFELGPMVRLLIASHALWFYAGKLLWPANLAFSYPLWTVSASDPRSYGWLLATIALGFGIWQLRRWTGRSVEVAALFYAATLSPVLGFIMLYTFRYSYVADHYQYLACLGPLALAAAGIARLSGHFRVRARLAERLAGAALILVLGTLTWNQCGLYVNLETLWRGTIERNPSSWLAHNNLGVILTRNNQTDEAMSHFREAIRLSPDYAQSHYNLGIALFRKRQTGEAMDQFREAIRLDPYDSRCYYNYAIALNKAGRPEEAIKQYQEAIRIDPRYVGARVNLGVVFIRQGRIDDAVAQFQEAVRLNPGDAEARSNLARALETKNASPGH